LTAMPHGGRLKYPEWTSAAEPWLKQLSDTIGTGGPTGPA
jgi:hypothetical protein